MNKIIQKPDLVKTSLNCIFQRTYFIFNFLSLLVHNEANINIEAFPKNTSHPSK